MKEPDIEGVAIHDGPESCVVVREGRGEALTGVHAGRPLSREINQLGVPTLCRQCGRQHGRARYRECLIRLPAVGDPEHAWNLYAREPGDPQIRPPEMAGGPHREG